MFYLLRTSEQTSCLVLRLSVPSSKKWHAFIFGMVQNYSTHSFCSAFLKLSFQQVFRLCTVKILTAPSLQVNEISSANPELRLFPTAGERLWTGRAQPQATQPCSTDTSTWLFPDLPLLCLHGDFTLEVDLPDFSGDDLDLRWAENQAVSLYCLLKPRAPQKPIVSKAKLLHTQYGICTIP